jgi:hydroxymethyl cephem carbamoyltransferase
MRILGVKEGHDGTYAFLNDGLLEYSLEAEKDSFRRCSAANADLLIRSAILSSKPPDIIAVGGWTKGLFADDPASFAGYFGSGSSDVIDTDIEFFGRKVGLFSSSHEASHIWGAYAMSPFPQGQPCYALVWEGNVGNFYYIDEKVTVRDLGCVLADPGNRYTFAFSMADTKSPDEVGFYDSSQAGKMMALSAFGRGGPANEEEYQLIDALMAVPPFHLMKKVSKSDFSWSRLYNCGVESQSFKDFSKRLSDAIFDRFYSFAKSQLKPGLPLLVSGGCGLNCEWNSRWRECGLFSEVFVPPCCNDSGCAIGTAAHAQFLATGIAKIGWSAYAGEEFKEDAELDKTRFERVQWSMEQLAMRLEKGAIFAWVEGKYEIGPRALGHRSLLAEPFCDGTLNRLNAIKQRETYRPIAPICTLSGMRNFSPNATSPYMLYFYRVTNPRLRAVTHVDGSARTQSVSSKDAPLLHNLLEAFGRRTGEEVLCNTSLNFNRKGFINRLSDLQKFAFEAKLEGFVVNGKIYVKK